MVDFVCRKLKLVVELDGWSHQFKIEEDSKHDQYLENLNYHVVGIAELEVIHDLPNVIRTLESDLPEENMIFFTLHSMGR
ncbi:DUF559 domain-containing protein [Tunicatimonas pelagia]|uniref:DUF559 domain-containing protein n=1 Tax=Tunicatimonas pelagia TaxID=931531 RepID=UPI00345CE0F2